MTLQEFGRTPWTKKELVKSIFYFFVHFVIIKHVFFCVAHKNPPCGSVLRFISAKRIRSHCITDASALQPLFAQNGIKN